MISLTLDNKNERIGAIVALLVHILILLIACFLVTCYKVPNPPKDPGQGIEIAFGTVVEDKGDTDNPIDAAVKQEEVQENLAVQSEIQEVVEQDVTAEVEENIDPIDPIDPIDQPLQSENLVEQVEQNEVIEEQEIATPTEVENTSQNEAIESPIKPVENPSEEIKEAEVESKIPSFGDLPGLPGGSGEKKGSVGDPNAKEKAVLSSGLGVAEIPRGWGIATEPKPAVKESGEVTISVEFNRSGHVLPGSVKYVSGSLTLFNKNKTIITKSLEEELKFTQTNTSEAPKSRNKATFRFEFKGH